MALAKSRKSDYEYTRRIDYRGSNTDDYKEVGYNETGDRRIRDISDTRHGGKGGTRQGGISGTRQGGISGTRQGGISGTRHGGISGTRHGGIGDTRQGGISDTRQGGISGTRHGGISDTRHGGISGTRHGGISDTRQGGISDTRHGGISDTRQGRINESRKQDYAVGKMQSYEEMECDYSESDNDIDFTWVDKEAKRYGLGATQRKDTGYQDEEENPYGHNRLGGTRFVPLQKTERNDHIGVTVSETRPNISRTTTQNPYGHRILGGTKFVPAHQLSYDDDDNYGETLTDNQRDIDQYPPPQCGSSSSRPRIPNISTTFASNGRFQLQGTRFQPDSYPIDEDDIDDNDVDEDTPLPPIPNFEKTYAPKRLAQIDPGFNAAINPGRRERQPADRPSNKPAGRQTPNGDAHARRPQPMVPDRQGYSGSQPFSGSGIYERTIPNGGPTGDFDRLSRISDLSTDMGSGFGWMTLVTSNQWQKKWQKIRERVRPGTPEDPKQRKRHDSNSSANSSFFDEDDDDHRGCKLKIGLSILVILFLVVIITPITIWLVKKGSPDEDGYLKQCSVSLALTNGEYSAEMGNTSSAEFNEVNMQFCNAVEKNVDPSKFEGCVVTLLRNGSIVVYFDLFLRGYGDRSVDLSDVKLQLGLTSQDAAFGDGAALGPYVVDLQSITLRHVKAIFPDQSSVPQRGNAAYEGSCETSMECQTLYSVCDGAACRCLQNMAYNQTTDRCDNIDCGQLTITNGNITYIDTTTTVTSMAEVSCDIDSTLIGPPRITCPNDGKWPQVDCVRLNCSVFTIENGYIRNISNNTSLELACDENYEFIGNSSIRCMNGNWSSKPSCGLVSCGEYSVANGSLLGVINTTGTSFGDKAFLNCSEGYYLNGRNNVTCLSDGNWSLPDACEPMSCDNITVPGNGSLVNSTGVGHVYGDRVSVECDSGYSLSGNDTIECIANGSWPNIPGCDRRTCEDLTLPSYSIETNTIGFKYQDTVDIQCRNGYNLTGNITVTCLAYGNWSDIPVCASVDCGDPMIPQNGSVTVADTTFMATANVTCDLGFNITGPDTLTCDENGNWSSTLTCELVSCGEFMPPANAMIVSGNVTTFEEEFVFSCETGYELIGSNTSKCIENGTWNITGSCQPVNCGNFTFPSNSKVEINYPSAYQDSIRVQCNEGYRYEHTNQTSVVCSENGTWVGDVMCVLVTCEQLDSNYTMDPEKTSYNYSDTVELNVTCARGYNISGSTEVQCTADGNWTTLPQCELIDCGEFMPPANATIVSGDTTTFEEEFVFRCETGYELNGSNTSKCIEHGIWNVAGSCQPVNCGNYSFPSNSEINMNYYSGYNDSIGVQCNEGYQYGNTNQTSVVCSEDGAWVGDVMCVLVTCDQIDSNYTMDLEKTSYNYSDTVELNVTCARGYNISGSTEVQCTADGNWTTLPQCELIDCGEFMPPANATIVSGDTTTFEEEFVFRCETGYELIGSNTSKCIENGTWNITGSCQPVHCGNYTFPSNSEIDMTHSSGYNDSIGVKCDEGYRYENTNQTSVVCSENGTWVGDVVCVLVTCEQIDSNYTMDPEKTSYNYSDTVELNVTCARGYNISGSTEVQCTADGNWTTLPQCELIDCGEFMPPVNATIVSGNTTTFEEEFVFRCETGYELNGSNTSKCIENGTWNVTGSCQPVNCGNYTFPSNSEINKTHSSGYNDSIGVKCDEGYRYGNTNQTSVFCSESGTWVGDVLCVPVTCSHLGGEYVLMPNKSSYNYQETVNVTCEQGYSISGNTSIQCTQDGVWNKLPTCTKVTCSLSALPNVTVTSDNSGRTVYNYTDFVTLSCNNSINKILIGNKTVQCQASGDWGGQPYCEDSVCPVLDIENAEITYISQFNATVQCRDNLMLNTTSADLYCFSSNSTWSDNPGCS